MNDKIVSIIIPVYQSKNFLENCIEKILNQSYKNFEIILVNDGSTDGSEEICNRLSKEYDCVKVIHQANKGVSAARNEGILNSIGKYILFLDSDDFLHNNTLSNLVEIVEDSSIDLVIFDFVYYNDNVNLNISANIEEGIFEKNKIVDLFWKTYDSNILHNVGTKLYKRDIINKYNIKFNEEYSIFEDIMFCIDYFSRCNKIFYLKKPMYYYYIHQSGSLRSSYKRKFLDAYNLLYSKIELFLVNRNVFYRYIDKFYENYMSGLSEIIKNECRYNKNSLELIKDISENQNTIKAKEYVTGINIKQKILFNLIWKKRFKLIERLVNLKISVKSLF